jgi:formylmethanofuran dehydrogenase subunit E
MKLATTTTALAAEEEEEAVTPQTKNTERSCSTCSTTETYGNWYRDGNGGWVCKTCYMREYFSRHPKKK